MVSTVAASNMLAFVLPQISFISVGSVVMAYGGTSPHFTATGDGAAACSLESGFDGTISSSPSTSVVDCFLADFLLNVLSSSW